MARDHRIDRLRMTLSQPEPLRVFTHDEHFSILIQAKARLPLNQPGLHLGFNFFRHSPQPGLRTIGPQFCPHVPH